MLLYEPVNQLKTRMTQTLIEQRFDLHIALNHSDVLRNLRSFHYPIFICSCNDNEDTTISLISKIKNSEDISNTMIFVHSNKVEKDYFQKMLFLGASGFFLKPFVKSQFIQQLCFLLDYRQVPDERRSHLRIQPPLEDNVRVMFRHPESQKMKLGIVINVSLVALEFQMFGSSKFLPMKKDSLITNFQLIINQSRLECQAHVLRVDQDKFVIKINELAELDRSILCQYIFQKLE